MFKFIKQLSCKHSYQWVRNIYGDEIIEYGWKRSVHKCSKCGNVEYKDELNKCKVG